MTQQAARGLLHPVDANSRLISEREFASIYAAADFAYAHGLYFNTTATVAWRLLGDEGPEAVQQRLTVLLKAQRDWFDQRRLPHSWIYCHEVGPTVGLHTHFVLAIPGSREGWPDLTLRADFRRWMTGWPARQLGRAAPRAVRVRGPAKQTPWLHWLLTHYLLKGYDPAVIVRTGRDSPSGRPTYLGDLIAFPWRDPGPVALSGRVGVSSALGPERRKAGRPGAWGVTEGPERILDPFRGKFFTNLQSGRQVAAQAFRSRYENGARDVQTLYPPDFLARVERFSRAVEVVSVQEHTKAQAQAQAQAQAFDV
ncbi:hypothetical protein [Phenylobacterium sp.]|uniref:hypothetical protein n=1 Tax=Phenylobacterium sp. TaxID=1871053 RepID=UPI002737A9C1|nr:hypothetical protein [Phenylobacterium sp.]MDP3870403.1 hypothetical protein [Phenylobacterium sp.]